MKSEQKKRQVERKSTEAEQERGQAERKDTETELKNGVNHQFSKKKAQAKLKSRDA